MKILVLAASAQQNSLNKKLAAAAAALLQQQPGITTVLPDFKDFTMPIYDGDLEQTSGVPAGAQALASHIASADAMVLCTPEYNGGIPGSLKNALDWVSRLRPHPWAGKPLLITGASPGALGAVRGLWHTRVPFEAVGAWVFPDMFGLGGAMEAFDEQGQFKDARKADQLNQLLQKFTQFAAGAVPRAQ